jgi:hypothetical protein
LPVDLRYVSSTDAVAGRMAAGPGRLHELRVNCCAHRYGDVIDDSALGQQLFNVPGRTG